MYKVIMAPTEGSDSEKSAISVAAQLAQRFEADLRLVRVKTTPLVIQTVTTPAILEITEQTLRDEHMARLRALEPLGTEYRSLGGIRVITALEEGPVAPALRDYARKFNVDLIVMASHARGGARRILLGSVTDYLIRHANVPVLIVRSPASFIDTPPAQLFSRIVVPLDGSTLAEQILPEVARLASRLNSTISLLRVLTPVTYSHGEIMQPGLPWWDVDTAIADASLARAERYLVGEGLKVIRDVVLSNDVSTAIVDYAARAKAGLIAIATNGSGGMSRFVLGKVADEVTRKAPSSVLVFQPKRPGAPIDTWEHSSEETLAGV